MKMLKKLSMTLLGILLLSACSGVIRFSIDVEQNLPPNFTVSNLQLTSNFTATLNGETQPVICDDRSTTLTYSFNFNGELDSWYSYLQGVTTKNIPEDSRVLFDANSDNVDYRNNFVRVEYTIPSQIAPLSNDLSTQTIVVNPRELGKTQLFVEINGYSKKYNIKFKGIPVLATCNN
jgi:hypothetical protein